MEPTRPTVCAIMRLRRAAHLLRWAVPVHRVVMNKDLLHMALVAAVLTACGPSKWDETSAVENDEAVYRGVLDSTILPEVRRLSRPKPDGTPPPMMVGNRTVPV